MKWRELGLAAGALALLAATASAQSVYEKRVASMKSQGAAMGAIGKYVKGEAPYSPAVPEAAKKLQEHSMSLAAEFPKGSEHEKSRAKAEIWTDWAGFEKQVKDFQAASASLVAATAADDKEKIAAAQGAVGKTCGGCHDAFRGPPKT